MTTTMCISELNDAAYTLAPSGFAPPLLASTRTSLLACSLHFDQVGLRHNSCPHPLGNNNEFHALTLNPNASGLARRDLIHTFPTRNLGTKCWGKTLQIWTKYILPLYGEKR
jgi:hypothetical protein